MPITINNVTLSFPSLFQPKAFDGNQGEAKYQTQMIIPKGSLQEQQITEEYNRVLTEAIAGKKLTRAQATPLIRPMGTTKGLLVDCDDDPDRYPPETFAGCYLFSAKSKKRPLVVDMGQYPIDNDEKIYGGVVANVNVNIYAYNRVGSGIAVGLNGVQKVKDGERLGGGRPSVTDMFGAPAAASDDIYD